MIGKQTDISTRLNLAKALRCSVGAFLHSVKVDPDFEKAMERHRSIQLTEVESNAKVVTYKIVIELSQQRNIVNVIRHSTGRAKWTEMASVVTFPGLRFTSVCAGTWHITGAYGFPYTNNNVDRKKLKKTEAKIAEVLRDHW